MYNLRSNKQQTLQLPVEIQLSDDNQFLQTFLSHNCASFEEKVSMSDSDSEGSGSDLNCSDIMRDSDNEHPNNSNTHEGAGPSHQKQLQETSSGCTSRHKCTDLGTVRQDWQAFK